MPAPVGGHRESGSLFLRPVFFVLSPIFLFLRVALLSSPVCLSPIRTTSPSCMSIIRSVHLSASTSPHSAFAVGSVHRPRFACRWFVCPTRVLVRLSWCDDGSITCAQTTKSTQHVGGNLGSCPPRPTIRAKRLPYIRIETQSFETETRKP